MSEQLMTRVELRVKRQRAREPRQTFAETSAVRENCRISLRDLRVVGRKSRGNVGTCERIEQATLMSQGGGEERMRKRQVRCQFDNVAAQRLRFFETSKIHHRRCEIAAGHQKVRRDAQALPIFALRVF